MCIMKILIAEDNTRVRQLIGRFINVAAAGAEVLECSSGEQAIAINRKEHPDLIVMDIMMGSIDGISATRRITREFPQVKIVIVSQLPEEEYKAESLQAGAAGYLNKAQLHELPAMITALIN